jgi:hypothetical protein
VLTLWRDLSYLDFDVSIRDADRQRQILPENEGELDAPNRPRKVGRDPPSAPVECRRPNRLPNPPDASVKSYISHQPRSLHFDAPFLGRILTQRNRKRAMQPAAQLRPIIREMRARGLSIAAMTAELNARGIPTRALRLGMCRPYTDWVMRIESAKR